jgi:hypothetical protein
MSVPQGTILGSYRLLERVGQGGMGIVYRAQHLRLGSEAAVKVLPVNLAGEPEFLRRFEREAASAAALQHPNILAVWDYGEQDGTPYFVMPHIAGGTLKDQLARGPLPWQDVVKYLRQMADALDYAHERGIIHRDVKPANMLVDQRGQLYLADFGIARALEGSEGLTRAGAGIGTPEYMAPEQAQGRADARSDLYALGVTVYQMLAGRVPYSGNSTVEVLMKHLQHPLPLEPLRSVQPSLPAGVEEVLRKALAKNPDERYQSGHALDEALTQALAGGSPAVAAHQQTVPTPSAHAHEGAAAHEQAAPATPRPVGGAEPGVATPSPAPQSAATGREAARAAGDPVAAPSPAPPQATRRLARSPVLAGALIGGSVLAVLCLVAGLFALTRLGGRSRLTAQGVAASTARAAAAATRTETRQPAADYVADFNRWFMGNASSGNARYSLDPATGEYRVALLRDDWETSTYTPEKRAFADFLLEVDAHRTGGPGNGGYGLVFRAQPQGSGDQTRAHYVFYLTTEGRYTLLLVNADRSTRTLQSLASSPAIKQGDAVNHLSVTCKGDQISLAVNGRPLGTYTAPVVGAGDLGVHVYAPPGANGVAAAFQNLRISAAP